jgi:hypothetical protein
MRSQPQNAGDEEKTWKVCHVVNTLGKGETIGNSSRLGSRVMPAQKANTANAFGRTRYVDGLSL